MEQHIRAAHTKSDAVCVCACVTVPRGGGRARAAGGRHSQQDLWRSPGQRRAAGGRLGQVTAEQRSQGDSDGRPATERRQIILV